jgi:hypothetical protein
LVAAAVICASYCVAAPPPSVVGTAAAVAPTADCALANWDAKLVDGVAALCPEKAAICC